MNKITLKHWFAFVKIASVFVIRALAKYLFVQPEAKKA